MIHIITGPPCAGKSTYISENAKAGDLKVDYDLIALALGAENSHAAEGLIKQAAFEAREGAIRKALEDSERESWIIHTTPSEDHMKMYEAAGAEFVHLDPGYEECMARARNDNRPQQTIEGIEKWYAGKKGRHMEHLYKNFEIKSSGDAGTISGYFSTYDRIPDSYGDIIAPGAFADTIKAREESGHPFPLCWNHDLDQIIGKVDKIEDTEKGPLMTASFFNTPLAQEKREIVKNGVVYQFSFAFDIREDGYVELEDGFKAHELRKLDLFEISVVPIPANQNAVMTDVKSEEPEKKDIKTVTVKVVPEIDEEAWEKVLGKSGRRNSKKDAAAIREAITLLQGVLGELEEAEEPETGEDEAKANTAVEEPEQSNPIKEKLLEYIKNMEVLKNDD